MSSTRCAPPHISAQSATVARSTTRERAGHAPPFAPISRSADTAASLKDTSQSLRVWSMVGRSFTSTPRVPFGTSRKLVPSSGVRPSLVRATTTSTSARCASSTKSFVPFRTNPSFDSRAAHVTPAASQRALGSVHASAVLARPAEQDRGQERPGHHDAAHLFHQHREVDEAEPRTAVLLGVDEPEPSLLGEL